MDIVVVFPAPLRPKRAVIWPLYMFSETLSTAFFWDFATLENSLVNNDCSTEGYIVYIIIIQATDIIYYHMMNFDLTIVMYGDASFKHTLVSQCLARITTKSVSCVFEI